MPPDAKTRDAGGVAWHGRPCHIFRLYIYLTSFAGASTVRFMPVARLPLPVARCHLRLASCLLAWVYFAFGVFCHFSAVQTPALHVINNIIYISSLCVSESDYVYVSFLLPRLRLRLQLRLRLLSAVFYFIVQT